MQDNTKRIAKNTVFLYIRMFVMMLIGLYTSRVILNVLGVEDYGIYNVVGGVVSMFSLLTAAMSSSISRFLTVELGRGDIDRLRSVFSTSLNVQLIMSAIIILATEIVGVWFLNNKLSILPERMDAANWVLQCSIITFVMGLIISPFNASIVSHERMKIFAYIGIWDALMKLIIVFTLYISPFDKLKSYSVLLLIVTILTTLIYFFYCRYNFEECRYRKKIDIKLIKQISSYAGWGIVGDGAWILNTQGVNILINIFFGVTLNAARGIANIVDNVIQGFVRNFMTALNPQIIKSYSICDYNYMHQLVVMGAKYSYYLMLFFIVPLCLEAEIVFKLWLGNVPEYAIIFSQLTLIASLIMTLGNTLTTAVSATGNIKTFEIVVGFSYLLIFPLTWVAFILGLPAIYSYIINIVIFYMIVFFKIIIVTRMIKMSCIEYMLKVILKTHSVTVLSAIIPLIICLVQSDSIIRLLEVSFLSTCSTLLSVWFVGMNKMERSYAFDYVKNKMKKQ